jgi:hypothetical protein
VFEYCYIILHLELILVLEIDKASPQSEISVNGNDDNTRINLRIEDITEFISVIHHLYVDTPGIASSSRASDSPGSSSGRSDSSGSLRRTEKDKSLFNILDNMKKELDSMKLQWVTSIKDNLFDAADPIAFGEIQGSMAMIKPEEIRQSMLDIDTVDIRSSKLTSPTSSIYQLVGNDKTLLEDNEGLKREIEELRREKESIQSEKDISEKELTITKAELVVAKEEIDRLEQESLDQTEEISQLKDMIKNVNC